VVFVGKPDNGSSGWDTSALRIDNLGSSSINVNVTVDIGTKRYALWGTRSVGAGKILILAQTAYENFDGSDTNPAGCYGCSKDLCVKRVRKTVPVVHVTIDGKRTDYYDVEQILNTRGVDGAGCPYTGKRNDESHNWVAITGQTTKPTNLGPAVDEEAFEEPVLSLAAPYPNPTRGSIEFDFRTPRDGPVRFAIYDVAGRLVRTVLDEVVEGGYYHAHVDLQGANAGIYYCSLSTRTEVVRGRFVMVK
jgi:hypothetical protein